MVKKLISILVACTMIFSLVACGSTSTGQTDTSQNNTSENVSSTSAETEATTDTAETDSEKTTTNISETDSKEETTDAATADNKQDTSVKDNTDKASGKTLVAYFSWSGNTKEMASYIAEQTNGEIFEIQPKTPYPEDYQKTGDIAKEERDSNARPEVLNMPGDISEYDTIFIGYPIWWHTAPMVIGTFLENYDLTGVDVYPFTQSASMDTEQFDNSMKFVRECAPGANVHDGLFVEATDTDGIQSYLTENGF